MEQAFPFKWLELEKTVTNIKYDVKMVNTKLYRYSARDASRCSHWTGWEGVAAPTRMQEGHKYSVQPFFVFSPPHFLSLVLQLPTPHPKISFFLAVLRQA